MRIRITGTITLTSLLIAISCVNVSKVCMNTDDLVDYPVLLGPVQCIGGGVRDSIIGDKIGSIEAESYIKKGVGEYGTGQITASNNLEKKLLKFRSEEHKRLALVKSLDVIAFMHASFAFGGRETINLNADIVNFDTSVSREQIKQGKP